MLILLFLPLAFFQVSENSYYATADDPTTLNIFTGSPNVLADNNTYRCIFVQLKDANGKISRALQDITVGLSSSTVTVGTVDSSVTIHRGETYAVADFSSTFNPGTTTISASATGFTTVYSTVTTLGPIPSVITVYGFPNTLPADEGSYPAIIVQLQDSTSAPARAPPGGVDVALSCSNTAAGTVTPNIRIPEGQTYAIANFNTTTLAETQARTIPVTVIATAQGYSPSQATITMTPVAENPTKLKIFTYAPKVLADQSSYNQIAVQLQNSAGYVAKTTQDTLINIASDDSSVCHVNSTSILAGKTYASTALGTTYKPGTANIIAVADNFPLTSQAISTFGFIASKLTVYCIPSSLPAGGSNVHQIVQVQLQDAQGRPALNTGVDLDVKLFSSQPTVAVVSPTLTISSGKSLAIGSITTTDMPGNTTITAQASGYTTGQTNITTSAIDFYPISSSCGANGLIIPSGTISVNLGSSQRFNATANAGYHVSNLWVDNVPRGSLSSYTFEDVTEPHTIYAEFSINKYDIVVTQTSNGVITPGTSAISHGEKPVFTITPNEGYYIANITVNGLLVPVFSSSGQSYQFAQVTANGSLTANFAPKKVPIQVLQGANGDIAPGTTTVDYGGSKTFAITAKTGYHIADVCVNGSSVGAVSTYTAENVKGDTTISATFAAGSAPTPTPTPAPYEGDPSEPSPKPESVVKAVTEDGSTVSLAVSGSISSQQITNTALTNSGGTVVVSFTLTGEDGTTGFGNITIPKGAIGFETTPTVYIDGQPAEDQGSNQDENYYYVWFTTHFSSHEVSIEFPSQATTVKLLPQAMTFVLPIAVVGIVVSILLIVLKKYPDLKEKVGSLTNKSTFDPPWAHTPVGPTKAVSPTTPAPNLPVAQTPPSAVETTTATTSPETTAKKSVPLMVKARIGFIRLLMGISKKTTALMAKIASLRMKKSVEQEVQSSSAELDAVDALTSETPTMEPALEPTDTPAFPEEALTEAPVSESAEPIEPTIPAPTQPVEPIEDIEEVSPSPAPTPTPKSAKFAATGQGAKTKLTIFTNVLSGIQIKRVSIKKISIKLRAAKVKIAKEETDQEAEQEWAFKPRGNWKFELRWRWRQWRSDLRWKLRRRRRW